MWSIGTVLIELFTGDALFQVHENHEHFAMMQHALGPLPPDMVHRARYLVFLIAFVATFIRSCSADGRKYFDRNGLLLPLRDAKAVRRVREMLTPPVSCMLSVGILSQPLLCCSDDFLTRAARCCRL